MENKNEPFRYSYSAREQEEIEEIRRKYLPKEESQMEKLRRLDQGVTKPGRIAALSIGILSCLLLGLGMSCTLVWGGKLFVLGIIIGLLGIIGIASAYPIYAYITKKRREKLAPEIMKLTDALMK